MMTQVLAALAGPARSVCTFTFATGRLASLALVVVLTGAPALAGEKLVLRPEVIATTDVLTLRDLADGASGPQASRPLFRAPALGETGTIQAQRIADAIKGLGLGPLDTRGRVQVNVTRAARRIGPGEIEAAVKNGLEMRHGVDIRPLSIVFDGTPSLILPPDVTEPVAVEDITYDRRSRRVTALVTAGPRTGGRRTSARITGAVIELVEVHVLTRALGRGDIVQASDVTLERRTRDTVPADARTDGANLVGQVAKRALTAGSLVRAADLARPEVVARGDIVTIVYEIPGLLLTLRGRANEAGAQGDLITVINPQSKRTLQARVVGPGKVSVSAPLPGPVASIKAPAQP